MRRTGCNIILEALSVHVRYNVVLVEVDGAAKLGIQDDLEFFSHS